MHSDGTITAAGESAGDLLVARFLADGTLDPAFGSGGSIVHAALAPADDLALDSTGRPVVPTRDGSGPVDRIGAVRLTTSGALDTAFDTDGVALTDFGLVNASAYAEGIAVLPDDRIVVTGSSWDFDAPALEDQLSRIPIVQFTTTGALDPTFGGGDGYVLADVPGGAYWGASAAIVVAPDGDLVTAGHQDVGYKGQNDAVVSRHLSDGSLDPSFTGDGIDVVRTGRYWNYLNDVTVTSTGTIVAVGQTSWGDGMVLFYDAAGDPVSAPTTNTLDGTPTHVVFGPPAVMDGDVRVFDKELIDAPNWAGTSLTVTRQGGADGRDEFAATGTLDAITEGASIVIDGVTVGTVTTNSGGTLRLDFDTGSTEARVSRVLQSLGYVNESRETGTVTMAWTFDDGVGAPANGTVDVTIIVLGISVNSTGDASDATPGDETCDTGSTNSEGDPECTLRAAIEELNAIGGGDITFTIPVSDAGHSAGVWTIAPGSDLPAITGTVDLDATTQTGWAAWSPVVAIDGTGLAEGQALVTVDSIASASRVAGLSIHRVRRRRDRRGFGCLRSGPGGSGRRPTSWWRLGTRQRNRRHHPRR